RNPKDLPRLTTRQVLAWARAHRRRTGSWPTAASGPILDASGGGIPPKVARRLFSLSHNQEYCDALFILAYQHHSRGLLAPAVGWLGLRLLCRGPARPSAMIYDHCLWIGKWVPWFLRRGLDRITSTSTCPSRGSFPLTVAG